ncbi:histidine kinase [Nocardiopsis sp. N85]|uniref:sensor histidine kinase n=1 Tax=Nocardiopsis sp. N85 TaxID=3029400 RepID=UPI00237FBF0C|nr:histidine kinase [Nocardiopsis sp. N85]MDE3723127.1 histidine kinase [Nocardiopsis sp. N85]
MSPRAEHDDPSEETANDRRMRVVRLVIMSSMGIVVLVMLGIPLLELALGGPGYVLWRSLAAEATVLPMSLLLLILLRDRIDGRRIPDPRYYWGSLVLLAATVLLLQGPIMVMGLIASWWGVGVFTAPRERTVVVTLALAAAPWPLILIADDGVPVVVHLFLWVAAIVWALLLASGSMATIWLWDITRQAVEGQHARARLAVTEERLRFSRDMHDLLGHSLSALAVKAELAGRLVDRAPDRAESELREVHDLAREALRQVRSAVSGYRELDLVEEVASVRGVIETAGARTEVTGLDVLGGLEETGGIAALAAWVVREGGTNVLRHSDATWCRIDFSLIEDAPEGKALIVEISNDRARQGGDGIGNGLTGLSERLSAVGGGLTAARTREGGFLLRAVLPV